MKHDVTSLQGQILANEVAMDETEITAKNGRIYTLTGVLIPPSIVPILPHRCDETKRETKLVRKPGNKVPKQLLLTLLRMLTRTGLAQGCCLHAEAGEAEVLADQL
jgi:hypothetical protein